MFRPSVLLRATNAYKPSIKFLGKRSYPKAPEEPSSPKPHPAAPTQELPGNFAKYREKATQHGPGLMNAGSSNSPASNSGSQRSYDSDNISAPRPQASSGSGKASQYGGHIGSKAGKSLGPLEPKEGEFFDRSELPRRFRKREWTDAEMDAISSGGASLW